MDAQSRTRRTICREKTEPGSPNAVSVKARAAPATDASCVACLLGLLEASIIPTLLAEATIAARQAAAKKSAAAFPGAAEIAGFASLCLVADATLATALVRQLVADGLALDEIFDRLIAPAARHLGDLWDEDRCDFNQATIASSRMQHIALSASRLHDETGHAPGQTPQALFAAMPGSQHTLGVLMVSELFRNEGWQVSLEVGATKAGLQSAAQSRHLDAIGLSIAVGDDIDELRSLIRSLKSGSINRRMKILIGGPLLALVPGLDQLVGADVAAGDAKTAKKLARALPLLCGR